MIPYAEDSPYVADSFYDEDEDDFYAEETRPGPVVGVLPDIKATDGGWPWIKYLESRRCTNGRCWGTVALYRFVIPGVEVDLYEEGEVVAITAKIRLGGCRECGKIYKVREEFE